jgi:hypothetical protein
MASVSIVAFLFSISKCFDEEYFHSSKYWKKLNKEGIVKNKASQKKRSDLSQGNYV